MNATELLKRLSKERQDWSRAGVSAEVSWTLRGIDISRRIIHAMVQEEQAAKEQNPPKLNRWSSLDLYRVMRRAVRLLHDKEPKQAIYLLRQTCNAYRPRKTKDPYQNRKLAIFGPSINGQ